MTSLRAALLMGLVLPGPGTTPATQVDWNGVAFSTNLTGTGQPWDGTWTAELGSFTAGFTPTAANTASWAAAWQAASRSVYQPTTRYFGGTFVYESNTPPFTAGARAYFWLFNPKAPQGEWLLLTNPAWTWPAGSPFDPFPVTWTSAEATQAIVGQVPGPSGNLTSAAVLNSPLPVLTFAAWQSLYFTPAELGNPAISGPAADPDQDGAGNLAEYGAGTLPRQAQSFPPPPDSFLHPDNGQTFGAARLHRSTRITGYTWQAQAGTTLSGWTSGTVTLTDLPWEWTVRHPGPVSTSPAGFLRFRLVP